MPAEELEFNEDDFDDDVHDTLSYEDEGGVDFQASSAHADHEPSSAEDASRDFPSISLHDPMGDGPHDDAGELHSISLDDEEDAFAAPSAADQPMLSLQGEDPEPAAGPLAHELGHEPLGHEAHDAGLDIGYGTGNRPAEGARHVTPGEILRGEFHGTESAGDFLGLDTEFTSSVDPLGSVGELADHEVSYPSLDDDYEELTSDQVLDDDLTSPFDVPVGANADGFAPPADPYDSEEGYEDAEGYHEDHAPGRFKLVLVTMACAMLGAFGVFYAPKFLEENPNIPGLSWLRDLIPGSGGGDDVAVAPRPPVAKDPVPRPANPGAGSGSGRPTPVADPEPVAIADPVDPVPDPPVATGPGVEPADPVVVDPPVSDPDPVAVDPEPVRPDPWTGPADPVSVATGPEVGETPDGSGDEGTGGGGALSLVESLLGNSDRETRQGGFPDLTSPAFGWVSDDRLDVIWRGQELPLEAIQSPVRTMMPYVGTVRVTMKSEELFEGRLYAVGQNRVWIDIEGGRIGLEGERIAQIRRLALGETSDGLVPRSSATGRRVRVRVPGGLLFGRVVKEDGEIATIVTDQGGRVLVESSMIESLGTRRAVLIHR